jgi:hypothetical protein
MEDGVAWSSGWLANSLSISPINFAIVQLCEIIFFRQYFPFQYFTIPSCTNNFIHLWLKLDFWERCENRLFPPGSLVRYQTLVTHCHFIFVVIEVVSIKAKQKIFFLLMFNQIETQKDWWNCSLSRARVIEWCYTTDRWLM